MIYGKIYFNNHEKKNTAQCCKPYVIVEGGVRKMENAKYIKYGKISFILAIAPMIVLFIGFLFCLIGSGGGNSDNDGGAIWWLFVFLIWILIPTTFFTSVSSIYLGIKSLKQNKLLLVRLAIAMSSLQLLGFLSLALLLLIF